MMEDRLLRGFVAGFVGGVVSSALSHLSYFWGFTTLRLSDWAAILIFAHEPPFSIEEHIFSAFIQLGWCGAIGSMFAYFLVWVTNRYILFKAWMLGTTPYFVIYLLTSLFLTPGTVPTPFKTALSNYITSTIFALIMGYSFKVLDQATMQHHNPPRTRSSSRGKTHRRR
jgi:fructose-specific phosphotransferase system IIC component